MTQAINHHGNSKANQTARRQVICVTRIEVYLCGLHDIFRRDSNDESHRMYVAARVAEDDTDFPSRHEKLWSRNSQTYGLMAGGLSMNTELVGWANRAEIRHKRKAREKHLNPQSRICKVWNNPKGTPTAEDLVFP